MENKDSRMVGNKGEWAELYAFMKLLSQGKVFAANENVERIKDIYYPILKITREEKKGQIVDYTIDENVVYVENQNKRAISITRKELEEQANILLNEIDNNTGSFEV